MHSITVVACHHTRLELPARRRQLPTMAGTTANWAVVARVMNSSRGRFNVALYPLGGYG